MIWILYQFACQRNVELEPDWDKNTEDLNIALPYDIIMSSNNNFHLTASDCKFIVGSEIKR